MRLRLLKELDEKDVIELTPEWLAAEYDRLNKELFGGKLGPCAFGIFTTGKGQNGGVLGWFRITGPSVRVSNRNRKMYQLDLWGEKNYVTRENFVAICKPKIELNGNYRWTKKGASSVLLHEMCHYYCNMEGWRPKQHHGTEFKAIAFYVSQKSNGTFPVERIANAEMMQSVELNAATAEKKQRRTDAKLSRISVLLIYMFDGTVRMLTTSSRNLINDIIAHEARKGRCSKIMISSDPELKQSLADQRRLVESRSYRFWSLTPTEVQNMERYNFNVEWQRG